MKNNFTSEEQNNFWSKFFVALKKFSEGFLYFLIWLVKFLTTALVSLAYFFWIFIVFSYKTIKRLTNKTVPKIKTAWRYFQVITWPRIKHYYQHKSPRLIKFFHLILKKLGHFIWIIISLLFLACKFTLVKLFPFIHKYFFLIKEKFFIIYQNRKKLKKKYAHAMLEWRLFFLWLLQPLTRALAFFTKNPVLQEQKEYLSQNSVINVQNFKSLLKDPQRVLFRKALASWMIFFLVTSSLGLASFTPLFNWLFKNDTPAYAATFTGTVKVSAGTTTLSTNGGWYTAMAYSGDGINGDAETGTFNPIHPGPAVTDGAAGALALGHVALAANTTYASAQFIGFKPSASGNLKGVQLILENQTLAGLANLDVVVELLSFPSASCTTSCSNYVTGTQGAYTYPSDTVVLSRAVYQFNQALSGENLAPGQFGRGTFDFRFDPEVAVTSGSHYGFRIINMGVAAPVFGTWAASAPYGDFPTINGTIRTIGISDIDLTNSPTVSMPLVLSGNLTGVASAMVAANSAAGVGLPTVRRTQNEHWTATYSSAAGNWTVVGSQSGTQSRKLTTASSGGTAASWVNDGVPFTALTADSTASTRLCVSSITGFATNQTIHLWDSDTATVSLTIASTNASDVNCSNGPSIITTAATTIGFSVAKNASVAQATWKLRAVQGAMTTLTADSAVSTRVCVASIAGFSAAVGTAASVIIWDNDTNVNVSRRIASTNASDGACPSSGPSIILDANLTTGFTTAQNAQIAEISANMSVSTPADGAILRFTAFNFSQNPIGLNTILARTGTVYLAYAKSQALATSNTNYPFLSNRHIYFVAYGDANTTAPADGDIVIVGNGKANADTSDSTNLTNDYTWLSKEQHIVSIDRSWDAPLAYTGNYGAAIGDGAGTRGNFAAYSQNGGWVSALVTPGSILNIADNSNQHYRITIPGKIMVDSNASVAFGTTSDPLPASTHADIYFDNISPAASTLLTVDSAASATLTVASTVGFAPGDRLVLDDNDSLPTAVLVAAVENATTLTLTASTVVGYTVAQGAFVAKGPTTELPTGTDRRAGIFTMTGLTGSAAGTQNNLRTGRVNIYGAGSDDFRTMKSDLAVDVDGNIDTGFLGNNSTDAGQTWVDVKDDVVGDWQPLDNIALAGATNQAVDNNFSSISMGANDDASAFPVWTGLASLGRNALPTPNTEIAEIGTIPMTNIYNADYNGGSTAFSQNYATTTAWTLFGDNANSEVNDAIYFGDQGNNMFYALEMNLATLLNASASIVWEFYNGSAWTSFTPRDAYKYQTRTGHSVPLSANTSRNSYTVSVTSGNQANFGVDQIVMIDDNDSSPIYRRITATAAGVITFSEPVTDAYTTAQSATISRLNGGQWRAFDPANIFTENGSTNARRLLAWTPYDLTGTPAKTTINGVNAYWVRARISSFSSWTTSPVNQNTIVSMSGIERLSSSAINVSTGSQEAKISEITTGASYDPNENYILSYGDSDGWVETHRYTAAAIVPPSAPYLWHINNGTLNINETNQTHLNIQNSYVVDSNYTVSGLVYMDMAADATARKLGFLLRQDLDGNGYAALISKTNAANTVGFYTTLAGVPTVIGSPTSKAFNVDTWYCLKAQVTGTTLNVKFWATSDCSSGEPGSWDFTTTNSTYTSGRMGIYAGSGTSGAGTKSMFDNITTDTGFSDTFTDNGRWTLRGSSAGLIGYAYPSVPFTSDYLNFTIKHKGGWNGANPPEIGDKIYLSSSAIRNYKGMNQAVGITTSNANTKYETWDFEWNPNTSVYDVTGSASGAAGSIAPGSTYTAPNNQISLRINSGNPTGTKFGNRMLLLQDNLLRNNGSWVGTNGMGSAVLIAPTLTLTSSAITPRYNIEGISGTATARQNGAIDFWFKPNYTGAPATSTSPLGMYLFDYAANLDTDRIFIRHNTNGNLEIGTYAAAVRQTLLSQSFSAVAGQWYHLRFSWDETANQKRAWLDGVAFSTGQASAVGARGANAGIIRLGNNWQYNAAFDGSIDEFAIFDDALDTSAGCDWGTFDVPATAWTGGATAGCGSNTGVNIFRASFDQDFERKEGFIWADYAFASPAMIFTNGADTGNDMIRVVTYPQRTRVWVDNGGEKYTPSARIKYGSGWQENATAATLAGWSHNFTYHHKAARDSVSSPTYSPVLNLKRSTHIWSDEEIGPTGATLAAMYHQGTGFGLSAVGLSGLATMNLSHLSMENQYNNFTIITNPYTSVTPYPSQVITDSVFYNYFDRAYTVANKTQGTNYVGAYFVTTHVGAANIGTGYNASASQNVGIDGSIFMGHRNAYVTVPPAAANGAASFFSGRLYTVANSEFHNNGITGVGTTGALNFSPGVAKVTINDNIFSVNNNGIRLYGNAFFTMSDNVFDGQVSDSATTAAGEYGAGIRAAQSYSSVNITDDGSIFGRGLWNEADINLAPNTATFEAESLLQFTGVDTQLLSPVLFGTQDYNNMSRLGDAYMLSTIPGTDIRIHYSSSSKDIINQTTFGNMRTTGSGLVDTTVHTAGGYAWRLEPLSTDVPLDYTAKVIGVANEPLAVTGYIRVNDYYGPNNLPTVTLSGLGMTGANLTWTAQDLPDTWQQFVVSGTPTESALAELKISVQSDFVVEDSGTSEIIANPAGSYLPVIVEDSDKTWTANQWVGYLFKDAYGRIFEVVRNTPQLLFLKGVVVPHLKSTTLTAATTGDYQLFQRPFVYIDDMSILSGTVDTGTLDFHSGGQPVSPWLSTGLTALGVWQAQTSIFENIDGSFGQLINDGLAIERGLVNDVAATQTVFVSDLTETTSNFYQNQILVMMSGANEGIARRISSYNGTTKAITLDAALPYAPAFNDSFVILNQYSTTSGGGGGATAEEIWNYTTRRLTDATLTNGGSIATLADLQALNNISAQSVWEYGARTLTGGVTLSNPQQVWDIATTLLTNAGSIGKLIVDNLNATVSSRGTSNLTAADVWSAAERTITDITDPGLSALVANVWAYSTRELTSGDLTAQRVWDTLTSAINTSNSIGLLLKTNIDATISSRASQISLDALAGNVTTILNEIGTGNIAAILADTSAINWADVTGLVTTAGTIQTKTDTIDWTNVTAIKTKTDTIDWTDIDGIKLKTDSIDWTDIATVTSDIANLVTEIGTGNITAIKTKTDTINWANVTGLVTSAGEIKTKTDTIDWTNVTAIKTNTDTINWADVTGIKTNTDTIDWTDIATIESNIATVITEIGTGNITAIKTKTDTINWANVTGLVTTAGTIQSKTDTIDWTNVTAIKTNTDTIDWTDVTGIKLKTDTIVWGDITDLGTDLNGLQNSMDLLANDLISVRSVVDTASYASTINTFGTELSSATNDLYNNALLTFTSGQNSGVARRIEDYNGTTKVISVEPDLSFAPADGDTFTILKELAVPVTKINTIQSDVAGIKDDVTLIKADIVLIKSRLDSIDSAIASLETALDNIEVTVDGSGTGSGETTNITNVYSVRPEDMFNSMTSISNSISEINTSLGRLNTENLNSILNVTQENLSDTKYIRNKVEDFKAVTNVQRQVIERAADPIVNTWYTSGSVDLNIMLSNPASTVQKVPFKIYLPKEAKMEHIMDANGLNIQYDIQLDTLFAAGEIELKPGESVKKFIKMRDIWQIAENDLNLIQSQAEDFYDKLDKTQYSAQALLLKNDIDTRVEKILRTQKENTASPQDKIMTFRENSESLLAAQKSLEELKVTVTQAEASRGFLGAFGGMQTISIWGIMIAFVTGFALLVAILFSMWRHQLNLMNGQFAYAGAGGRFKTQPVILRSGSGRGEKKPKNAKPKNSSKVIASKISSPRVSQKFKISFATFVKEKINNKWFLLSIALLFLLTLGIFVGPKIFSQTTTNNEQSADVLTDNTPEKTMEVVLPEVLDNLSFDLSTSTATSTASVTTENKAMEFFLLITETPSGFLNVRQEPSKTGAILTQLQSGDKVKALRKQDPASGEDYGWWQIVLEGDNLAWISAQYAQEIAG